MQRTVTDSYGRICGNRGTAVALLSLALAWGALPVWSQGVSDLRPEQAIELYDRARYDEAKPLLEELDAEGKADGALLYRLSFCLRAAGDRQGERRTLERAVAALEGELDSASGLETPFYLANAYRNLGRLVDARKVAAAATSRVEAGQWPQPEHPMEMFRLAKLYADQRREPQAVQWYRKALEGFAGLEGEFPANLAWARRYLAEIAYAKADFATAEREYRALVEAGGSSPSDYDRLAICRVRLAMWDGAVEAWQAAERLDPAQGNRPRYCWRLARMARELKTLPDQAPSGADWSQLTKEDLEALMLEQANLVKGAVASVTSGEVTDQAGRKALEKKIADAKPVFVRAALEYAVRQYPIRETAFFGGYAPLIFHAKRWKLPPAEMNRSLP